MNLLLYFYLIHFVADYPLQPNKLVEMKKRGYMGVFLHCLVHLAVLIIILMPFLNIKEVWAGIAVIFGTHNIIDQAKVYLDKKYKAKQSFLYFGDQALHLIIITAVSFYIGNIMPEYTDGIMAYYLDRSIVLYLLILVLVTYFYDVTRHFFTKKKLSGAYTRNYKRMLWNVFIVTVAFGMYWLAG